MSFAGTRCIVSLTVLHDYASSNTSLVPSLRQMTSNLTSQAATLTLGAILNDLSINLNPLLYIILVPIYAHIIYPTIDRLGTRFTPICRISTGFFLSVLAMTIEPSFDISSTPATNAEGMPTNAYAQATSPISPSGSSSPSTFLLLTARFWLESRA
jgi:hypothetical protein